MLVLSAGCGSQAADTTAQTTAAPPEEEPEVHVSLDGYKGPENIGVVLAAERGYFKDAGLSIGVYPPLNPVRPVRYVVEGTDELAVAQEPQVALAREKGAPLVVVGSVLPHSTAAMIWLRKSHIRSIADLKGRTIAIPGLPFQRVFLQRILAKAGLTLADVKVKRVDYHLVSALADGAADAIFGGSWNLEGATLKARGLDPVIRRVQSLGVPDYDELVVIARTDFATQHPRFMRGFMVAVRKGVAAAVEDPEAAVKTLLEETEGNPGRSRKVVEAEAEATLPLLSRTGYLSPKRAGRLLAWMHRRGLIRRRLTARVLLTNRFLAASRAAGS